MIIAYNKELLDSTYLVNEAKKLKSSGFITNEQFKNIKESTSTLKEQDNLFIRICLFLLGSILYGSICGSICILFLSAFDSGNNWKIFILFFALIGLLTTEFLFVRKSNYFGNGIDDAFIIAMQIALVSFIVLLDDYWNVKLIMSISIAIISLLCYSRYLHLLSLLASFLAFVAIVFIVLVDYIKYGTLILPFFLLFLGIATYFISKKMMQNISKPYHYNGLLLINSLSMLLSYFVMNYFVVRELSMELLGPYSTSSSEIPMTWLFYTFTLIIPIVYLFFGIKKKDKPMLWIGCLTIGFTVYTIRYYHHIMPIEISLTIAGILFFVIAYFAIRKLRNKESGLTFLPDRFESSNSLLNIETIASASQFGINTTIQESSPMEFGDGDFSGGGASDSF